MQSIKTDGFDLAEELQRQVKTLGARPARPRGRELATQARGVGGRGLADFKR